MIHVFVVMRKLSEKNLMRFWWRKCHF